MTFKRCPEADCGLDVPITSKCCPHCGRPSLFPNVVMAELPEETAKLDERYQQAMDNAQHRRAATRVQQFEQAVANSQAVLSCPIAEAQRLAESDKQLALTFYGRGQMNLEKGSNVLQGPKWDAIRPAAETAFFGDENKRDIHFASLTLDDRGLKNYGEKHGKCYVFLKENKIGHRTSVCHSNMLVFLKESGSGYWEKEELPRGFRSNWVSRGKLSVAKLADRIQKMNRPVEIPRDFDEAGENECRR